MAETKQTPSKWADPWTYAQIVGYLALGAALLRGFGPRTWSALWDAISGQTSAAWVQAVGSIAAIVFATRIATQQSAAQHRTAMAVIDRQVRLERASAGMALLAAAVEAAGGLQHVASKLPDVAAGRRNGTAVAASLGPKLRDVLNAVDGLDPSALPFELVGSRTRLHFQLRFATSMLEQLAGSEDLEDEGIAICVEAIGSASTKAQEILEFVDKSDEQWLPDGMRRTSANFSR